MPTLYPQIDVPEVADAGGLNEHGGPDFVATSASDTHTNSIWPGCFVVLSTNGYIAVASNFTAADYRVISIRDSKMNKLPFMAITTSALGASSAVYRLEVEPLGGLNLRITEDADTTPITTANAGDVGARYCKVLVTEPGTLTAGNNPIGAAAGKYLLDSSTVSTTTTTMSMQLRRVAKVAGNPAYSATTLANPRVFIASVITAAATQSAN